MKLTIPKPIVVIGGMGPQASLRFHQLLIEKSREYHSGNGAEYPHILHFSLPIVDFISDESRKTAAIKDLRSISDILKISNPAAITLACNTAHLLVPHVGFLQTPVFASMLEHVVEQLADDNITCVGLLASPTTIRTKLYEDVLNKRGIRTLTPNNQQQRVLEGCIRSVIEGRVNPAHSKALEKISESLINRGAEAILLGCTELPLLDLANSSIPIYDCLNIYAKRVINNYYLYNGA